MPVLSSPPRFVTGMLTDAKRQLEADFTRYSVVFTGEDLPDGRKADAVYIVLNDIYMQVINGAMTRPLDYDYLKGLPPASQRFYELLSYQMYAALKNDRPRAKLVYSEFCTYAPQARHHDWERVRSQMNKIYRPHKQSGYIAEIDYEQTVDADGRPDWIMLYRPGPKARAEYRAFAKRGVSMPPQTEPFDADPPPRLAGPGPSPLEAELIGRGVTPGVAAALVRDHGEEKVRAQGEILDWYLAKKPGKIDDPAAWLVSAIKSPTGHAAPKGFVSKADRERQAEAKRQAAARAAEERRRKRAEDAEEKAEMEQAAAYWASLTPKRAGGGRCGLDRRGRSGVAGRGGGSVQGRPAADPARGVYPAAARRSRPSRSRRVESGCGVVASGSVSTSRSSNRAGGFPAHGSRTRHSLPRLTSAGQPQGGPGSRGV